MGADGSFRFDDVPPRRVSTTVAVPIPSQRPSTHVRSFAASREVTVPEMPGLRSDQPLELGTMELKLKEVPAPDGAPATLQFSTGTFSSGTSD